FRWSGFQSERILPMAQAWQSAPKSPNRGGVQEKRCASGDARRCSSLRVGPATPCAPQSQVAAPKRRARSDAPYQLLSANPHFLSCPARGTMRILVGIDEMHFASLTVEDVRRREAIRHGSD